MAPEETSTATKPAEKLYSFICNEGYPLRTLSVMRNTPCACGSGKKSKRCCKTEKKYFSTAPQKPEAKLLEALAPAVEPEPAREPALTIITL